MPSDPKLRVTGTPDYDALAVLGYSVPEDGQTACIVGPQRRLARLVERAARDLDAALGRAEWNAIADAMSGSAEPFGHGDSGVSPLLLVAANLQDSPEVGPKWGIDPKRLARTLNALTPAHGEAILAAVRWFWRNADGIDPSADEWWTPAYRRR